MKSVILGGGGAKGCFEAGVLYTIFDRIKFDNIFGTSTGALNALILGQCYIEDNPDLMKEIWTEKFKKNRDIYRRNLLRTICLQYPFDFKPLRKKIDKLIDFDAIHEMKETITIATTDIISGQTIFFNNHSSCPEEFKEAVIASASMPPAFHPVKIGDKLLVDGGIRENVPIKAFESQKQLDSKIIIILCTVEKLKPVPPENFNIIETSARVIDIMMNEITNNDINTLLRINELLKQLDKLDGQMDWLLDKKVLDIDVIAPSNQSKLSMSSALSFDHEYMLKGFNEGRRRARKYLEKL